MTEALSKMFTQLSQMAGSGWGSSGKTVQYSGGYGGLGCFGYGSGGMDYSTEFAIADAQSVFARVAQTINQSAQSGMQKGNSDAPNLTSYATCFDGVKYKDIKNLQKLENELKNTEESKGTTATETIRTRAKLEEAEKKMFGNKVSIMPSKMFGKGFYTNLEESELKQIQDASKNITTRRSNLEKQVKELITLKCNPNLTSAEKSKVEAMAMELKAEQESLANEVDVLNKYMSEGVKSKDAKYNDFKATVPALDAQKFITDHTKDGKLDAKGAVTDLLAENPQITAKQLKDSSKLTDDNKLALMKELLKESLKGNNGKLADGLETAIGKLTKSEDVEKVLGEIKAGKNEVKIDGKSFKVPNGSKDSKAVEAGLVLAEKPAEKKAEKTAGKPGTQTSAVGSNTQNENAIVKEADIKKAFSDKADEDIGKYRTRILTSLKNCDGDDEEKYQYLRMQMKGENSNNFAAALADKEFMKKLLEKVDDGGWFEFRDTLTLGYLQAALTKVAKDLKIESVEATYERTENKAGIDIPNGKKQVVTMDSSESDLEKLGKNGDAKNKILELAEKIQEKLKPQTK